MFFFFAWEEEDATIFFFHVFVLYLPPSLLPSSYLFPPLVFLCAIVVMKKVTSVWEVKGDGSLLPLPSSLVVLQRRKQWQLVAITFLCGRCCKEEGDDSCHRLLLGWVLQRRRRKWQLLSPSSRGVLHKRRKRRRQWLSPSYGWVL